MSGAQAHEPRQALAGALCAVLVALLPVRLLLAADAPPAAAGTAAAAANQAGEFEAMVLEVRANSQAAQEMLVVLRDGAGNFWLEEDDFSRLRLRLPEVAAHQQDGRRYFPLSAIAGVVATLDAPRSRLELVFPAAAFVQAKMSAPVSDSGYFSASSAGLLFNYQLYGQHVQSDWSGGALTDLAFFSRFGVLDNTVAMREAGGSIDSTRLETTFTRDFPDRLVTLRLGDAITTPGSWGSALRFAGVQFGRNFAIRPDLVTAPLLSASGNAVVPSMVDVFVNQQHVYSSQVQPGPFTIENLPVVSGTGDVQVVVRDALGRQQVLSQRFYSSPSLLARGLDQYSLSLGAVRQNFTQESFDYGSLVGAADYRRGLTNSITAEGHAEFVQGGARALGATLAARLWRLGVASITVARGGDSASSGWLRGISWERQGMRFSMGASLEQVSDGYRQVAQLAAGTARLKLRGTAHAGLGLGLAGNLSMVYARRDYRGLESDQSLGITHFMQVGRGTLSTLVTRGLGSARSTSAFIGYTLSLGPRRSMEASSETLRSRMEDRDDLRASILQSLPVGEGSGWRLSASQKGSYDALWQQRLRTMDVEVQASRNFGQSGQNINVRGGATWLDGTLRAARSVDGSFAVVDLNGLSDVPVYVENQFVARTDARGRAVLNNLLPYQTNRVSIDPVELPLDASIESRTIVVQPGWRSGVVARFPVERVHPGLFRLVRPDGSVVPAGAAVRFNGADFVVAKDGVTYVTTLDHGSAGVARWEGGQCEFRLEPPNSGDPLTDLGDVTCRSGTGNAR